MRNYGIENFRFYFRRTFKFEGREKLSDTERTAFNEKFKAAYLHPCETYWIRRLGLMDDSKGYNKKESGEGGAGHVWTDEQKAKRAQIDGHTRQNPSPAARYSKDGETHQKVRLTRYESAVPRKELTRELFMQHLRVLSERKELNLLVVTFGGSVKTRCIRRGYHGGMGGGSARDESEQAVISKLKLANGDYLEQWHDSMSEAGRTLSTADKKVSFNAFPLLQWQAQNPRRVQFRRVTTEKRKDFDKDGKRIIKYKEKKT